MKRKQLENFQVPIKTLKTWGGVKRELRGFLKSRWGPWGGKERTAISQWAMPIASPIPPHGNVAGNADKGLRICGNISFKYYHFFFCLHLINQNITQVIFYLFCQSWYTIRNIIKSTILHFYIFDFKWARLVVATLSFPFQLKNVDERTRSRENEYVAWFKGNILPH